MRRAIELAKQGMGGVNPNPLVGAVLVKNHKIIGEGFHEKYGSLHAERNAFANATKDPEGADLYVTLEPCCHFGKQPPCTQAIIEHGIRNVYVGSNDPNELVAGKGIAALREAGIHVETEVLKEECDAINPVFFHYITTNTPYVVMKYAMTMDGKIATDAGNSQWITEAAAREHVHETRNWLTGIMVGIGTVLADNPLLTCRLEGGRNPVRIICDSHGRIPLGCQIVETAKDVPTYLAVLKETAGAMADKLQYLKDKKIHIIEVPEQNGHIDLNVLMKILGQMKIDSILLEGGGTLNQSALLAGIVNRVQVYIAPKIFGGSGTFTPVAGQGVTYPHEAIQFGRPRITYFDRDILLEYERL